MPAARSLRPRPGCVQKRFSGDSTTRSYLTVPRSIDSMPRAGIDVRHVEVALGTPQIDARRNDGWSRTRAERHRIEAAGRLGVQQRFRPVEIDQIDPHLLALADRPGAEKMPLGQRVGIFVLGVNALERVVVPLSRPDRSRRPARCGPRAVRPSSPTLPIDDGQRAPRPIVAGGESADEQLRPGNRAVIEHGARRVRVVAPVDGVVGAVGITDPGALGVAEVAVDVLPAVVDDPAVGQQRRVPFEQRAVPDLLDVGSVGVHREQVAHDVPVAHAVLRLARRAEHDDAVGQVDRIDIADTCPKGQLPQPGSVGARVRRCDSRRPRRAAWRRVCVFRRSAHPSPAPHHSGDRAMS